MSSSRFKSLIPPFLLVAAMVIAYLMVASRPDIPLSDTKVLPPKVNVMVVKRGEVTFNLVVNGTAQSYRQLDLSSEVAGKVIWVSDEFVSGGRVSQGASLLKVDPLSYQVALAEAKSVLASAQLSLADAQVRKQKAAIKESQARVDAAQARIKLAEQDLDNTHIRAPFDSIIDSKSIEFAQFINRGMVVARLLDTSKAEIRLPITNIDRAFLAVDSNSFVAVKARYGEISQQWQGRLVRIESRIDQQTRVFPAIVEVEYPYDKQRHKMILPLGTFVEVILPSVPIPNAVAIPRAALHGSHDVFVIEKGSLLTRRSINIVKELDESVIVNDGLKDDDQVVITRLPLMFAGMEVVKTDG